MIVEVASELEAKLKAEESRLQVAAAFVTSEELMKNYLNRPYGNAYDFSQVDKLDI
jgi:hypothetical protein